MIDQAIKQCLHQSMEGERERDCSQAYMEYALVTLVHSPCECEELDQWNLVGSCMLDTRPSSMFCLQYVFCSGLVGRYPASFPESKQLRIQMNCLTYGFWFACFWDGIKTC